MRTRVLLALFLLGCGHTPRVKVDTIPPRPEDVATVDGMMKAFYEVVNLTPDQPRQWSRDRTLYVPWLRFVSIGKEVEVWNHQEFVEASEPLVAAGFREHEIHRVTRQYGNIVHIDSVYETESGPDFSRKSRGMNSIEMYWDGKRWWIVSVIWQSETPEFPLPERGQAPPAESTLSR